MSASAMLSRSKIAHSETAHSQKSGKEQTYAERKAAALSAKNTVVMSYDELERIKSMCSNTNTDQDYQSMRQSQREELQKKSAARVSKWPNTINAERERKEYERIKKLEDEEVSFDSGFW